MFVSALAKSLVVPICIIALSACAGESAEMTEAPPEAQGAQIVGKVQMAPVLGFQSGDENFACTGVEENSLQFNGQRVTLKDADGAVVGVTILVGFQPDLFPDSPYLDPSSYGYNDGTLCAWDFVFSDVIIDSAFYSFEFSDDSITPINLSKQEILGNLVITLG
jgi:hypothetical protein